MELKNSHPISNETHVIVHTSNTDRINFNNSENYNNLKNLESVEINGKISNFELNSSANVSYSNLETYPNPNYQSEYQTPLYSESETYNWPYDLSRNGLARQRVNDINRNTYEESNYVLGHQPNPLIIHDPNYGRSYLNSYINGANMKGNCVTMCPTNYSPSPVNSSIHDYNFSLDEFDHYDDNNNQTFHNHNNNHITTLQDVFEDKYSFKQEYNPLVEDAPETSGSYITLTSAAAGPHPHDLHMLREYSNNHQLHHSTSSGDSRSPTGFSPNEFDTNMNFTQLNTPRNSSIMYAALPVGSNEQNLNHPPAYDSLNHGMSSR